MKILSEESLFITKTYNKIQSSMRGLLGKPINAVQFRLLSHREFFSAVKQWQTSCSAY